MLIISKTVSASRGIRYMCWNITRNIVTFTLIFRMDAGMSLSGEMGSAVAFYAVRFAILRRKGMSTGAVWRPYAYMGLRGMSHEMQPYDPRVPEETVDLVVPAYVLCKQTVGAFIFIDGSSARDMRTWRMRSPNSSRLSMWHLRGHSKKQTCEIRSSAILISRFQFLSCGNARFEQEFHCRLELQDSTGFWSEKYPCHYARYFFLEDRYYYRRMWNERNSYWLRAIIVKFRSFIFPLKAIFRCYGRCDQFDRK